MEKHIPIIVHICGNEYSKKDSYKCTCLCSCLGSHVCKETCKNKKIANKKTPCVLECEIVKNDLGVWNYIPNTK